ncbi:restriction endonuclease subunit S [Brucella gallinifaecis]|uniref:Restriction endonuclease subunit S n=1 Tax=Brucella gallinifaecis TaxID=215590 RepID=A0A502BK53_9HYPH|nr:restriction endonuclease subunit S [Brucella gallinifaecis]TPF74051.1 restriction endonuclease subunit S [Brucella gallinifaecis]
MMPSSWKEQALSSVVKSPISYGVVQTGEPVENGVPCVRVVDIASGDLNPKHMIKTTREISNSYKRTILEAGDVIMALRGVIGRSALVSAPLEKCNLTRGVARISLNSAVASPAYVFQFLNAPQFQSYIGRQANGSALQEISIATLRKAKISLPPVQEQQRIAKILSTWDRAIEATEKLIANSEAQKKALMQQLLTGKKRLPGFEGEWKDRKLGDVAQIGKGRALNSKDIQEGNYPVIAGGKTSPYSHAEFTHDHAITVSASGAYAGFVAFHPYKFWASDCSVVQGTEKISALFAFYYLEFNQNKIYGLQSGGAQPHIYPRDIASLIIEVPSIDEQKAIVEILTESTSQIEKLKNYLERLKREKSALMQQLLTGKRRVKTVSDREEAA